MDKAGRLIEICNVLFGLWLPGLFNSASLFELFCILFNLLLNRLKPRALVWSTQSCKSPNLRLSNKSQSYASPGFTQDAGRAYPDHHRKLQMENSFHDEKHVFA